MNKWSIRPNRTRPVRENVLQTVRRAMLATVSGDVIELGAGDGKSLPYYPYQNLRSLTLVDPRFSKSAHNFDVQQVPVTFVHRRIDAVSYTHLRRAGRCSHRRLPHIGCCSAG